MWGKAIAPKVSERVRIATFLDWLSFSITSKFLKSFHNAFRFFSSHFHCLHFIHHVLFRAMLPSALNRMCCYFFTVYVRINIQCILFMSFTEKKKKPKKLFRRRSKKKEMFGVCVSNLMIKATFCSFSIHLFIHVKSNIT